MSVKHRNIALLTVMLCGALPTTLLSLFAGVVVDRVDRRKFLAWLQAAMMVPAFTLAVLVYTGHVQYWHVLVLAAVSGLANTFDMPTRLQSSTPWAAVLMTLVS